MELQSRNVFMVFFLLTILSVFILIYYPILMGGYKRRNLEHLDNNKKNVQCCGNIDWYYGNKLYKELCNRK